MKRLSFAAAALLALSALISAQTPQTPTSGTPAAQATPSAAAPTTSKRGGPKPAVQQAPGGGPDQVWVNTNSSVYHCPGDRFYGKTAHGRYMTEAAAKSAGGKGVGGKTCFGGK